MTRKNILYTALVALVLWAGVSFVTSGLTGDDFNSYEWEHYELCLDRRVAGLEARGFDSAVSYITAKETCTEDAREALGRTAP